VELQENSVKLNVEFSKRGISVDATWFADFSAADS
jgi:hypothetical protein